MAARRKPDYADPLGIDAPILGFAPDQADSSLIILHRPFGRLFFGLSGPARHPLLEDDAGHADRIRPGRDLFSLQFPIEIPVTASGTDQHRSAGVLVLRRPIDADRGFGD